LARAERHNKNPPSGGCDGSIDMRGWVMIFSGDRASGGKIIDPQPEASQDSM